jgi:AcrR family transcriptional regulator
MQSKHTEDGVRERLIISGINELFEHGISDFSLRRAASRAQVSCAAPYRHFKDKDEMIREIVKYIISKWTLLCREIEAAFSEDKRRLALEVSMATLRFWLGNSKFRSILTLGASLDSASDFDSYLISTLNAYAEEKGIAERREEIIYRVRSAIYGTVMLVSMGRISGDERTVSLFFDYISSVLI